MRSPFFGNSRVVRNFLAQGYGQAATIAIQLGTIPILLSAWGAEKYGAWLILTSIASYLMFSDFGFTSIAKNDMSIRVAGGDHEGALATYQSVFLALTALTVLVATAACITLAIVPIDRRLHIGPISPLDAKVVIGCQIVTVLAYQIFLLFCAGFRAEGRAATEALLTSNSRLFEAVLLVGTAILGHGLATAAVVILCARIVQILGVGVALHRQAPWLRLGRSKASWARMRQLLLPSLTYMLSPIANAMLIQGPLVLLGAGSTPQQVTSFSVTRTFTRLGTSGANLLNMTFSPEYSYAFGARDPGRFWSTLRIHAALTAAGVLAFFAAIALFGQTGIRLLSHGHLQADVRLLSILAWAAAFEIGWSTAFSAMAALNAHKVAATCAAAIAVMALTVTPKPAQPLGVGLAVSVANGLLLVCCLVMLVFSTRRIRPPRAPQAGELSEVRP